MEDIECPMEDTECPIEDCRRLRRIGTCRLAAKEQLSSLGASLSAS